MVFVDDAGEGIRTKRNTGASSSKLPMESPGNTDDTQDYQILEAESGTTPIGRERRLKVEEQRRGSFLDWKAGESWRMTPTMERAWQTGWKNHR